MDPPIAGVVLHTPEGDKIKCMIHLDFPPTNNEVEYEALVASLDLAKAAGAENMVVYCDSQVVTSQINGDYECKKERMNKYLEVVKGRIGSIQIRFVHIPREENECADRLAKAASAEQMLIPNTVPLSKFYYYLKIISLPQPKNTDLNLNNL